MIIRVPLWSEWRDLPAFSPCGRRRKSKYRPVFELDDERPAGAFDYDSSPSLARMQQGGRRASLLHSWSEWRDLNPRPDGPKPPALPTALHPDTISICFDFPGQFQASSASRIPLTFFIIYYLPVFGKAEKRNSISADKRETVFTVFCAICPAAAAAARRRPPSARRQAPCAAPAHR